MNEADLLVVLGASFSNHTGIYRGHPIVQVDLDPLQLGKFHKVDVPVWGEVGVTSRAIAAALPASRREHRVDQRPQVAERHAIWRAEKASRRRDDRGHGVASANVFDSLSRLTPAGMVIAVDVGNNTYSFGRYFECKPGQRVLMSGYLGSIGFGYPAAIGAYAATGEPVLGVTGDGGFGQYMGEILTAVKHDMNITHVLLNNGQLGKISKEQQAGQLGRLGDLAAQPRLQRVRADLRRARDPRDLGRPARRGDRDGARARRPGARGGRHRRRAHLRSDVQRTVLPLARALAVAFAGVHPGRRAIASDPAAQEGLLARQAARESGARSYPRRLPVALARGLGVHVWDASGRRYIDCLAGAGSLALGHHHPVVVAALRRALDDEVPLTTLDLATPLRDAFIDALVDALPPELADGRILFCGPSGADAVEAAVKLCKVATGRSGVIAFGGGYHGMTQGALSLTGAREPKERLGALLPDVHHLPFPTRVRCPFGVGGEAGAERCARVFEWALEDGHSGIATPAAVIMEPVQGEGGVHPAPPTFARLSATRRCAPGCRWSSTRCRRASAARARCGGWMRSASCPTCSCCRRRSAAGCRWRSSSRGASSTRRGSRATMPGRSAATSSRSRPAPRRSATSSPSGCGSTPARWARGCARAARGDRRRRARSPTCAGAGSWSASSSSTASGWTPAACPSRPGRAPREVLRALLDEGVVAEIGGRGSATIRFLPPLVIEPDDVDRVAEAFGRALRA